MNIEAPPWKSTPNDDLHEDVQVCGDEEGELLGTDNNTIVIQYWC